MAQLLSMGELWIDFTPVGTTEDGRLRFARNPGGAPANVAVQALRAGVSAGFLGRVGKDMFGDFLADTLQGCGVETQGLERNRGQGLQLVPQPRRGHPTCCRGAGAEADRSVRAFMLWLFAADSGAFPLRCGGAGGVCQKPGEGDGL